MVPGNPLGMSGLFSSCYSVRTLSIVYIVPLHFRLCKETKGTPGLCEDQYHKFSSLGHLLQKESFEFIDYDCK